MPLMIKLMIGLFALSWTWLILTTANHFRLHDVFWLYVADVLMSVLVCIGWLTIGIPFVIWNAWRNAQ